MSDAPPPPPPSNPPPTASPPPPPENRNPPPPGRADLSTDWSTPRRTHPVSPLLDLVGLGRGALPLVFFLVATGRAAFVPVVLVVYAVVQSVAWFRRTWSFDGEMLTLDDGVLKRTFRRVPVSRVQQVEVHEAFLHRLAGLAVLRIETAGGAGSAEITVQSLPREEAVAVRATVLRARDSEAGIDPSDRSHPIDPTGVTAAPSPSFTPAPEHLVFRLSTARALLAGTVSSNLLIVFAFAGTALDVVSRLPGSIGREVEDQAVDAAGSLGLLVGLGLLASIGIVVAALTSLAAHHDLTVVRTGDELRMRRGLFDRRDAVVPLARIQSVTLRQNPIQRLLGFSAVRIRSAGSGVGADARLLIPLVDDREVDVLLGATLGRSVPLGDLPRAPIAARGRRIARRALLLLPPAMAAGVVTGSAVVAGVASVLGLILAVVLGLDAYRNLGHRVDGAFLVTRWGSILRRTVVVVGPRIQSLGVRSSPPQRWRGLATLTIDLAGSGLQPVVVDHTDARCQELWHDLRSVPVELLREVPGGFRAGGPVRETGADLPIPPPNEEP